MPVVRDNPGGRIPDVELLPAWLQRQIEWDRTAPRCDVCRLPMSAYLHSLGATAHVCCGSRYDKPDPREVAEGIRIMREAAKRA